MEQTRFAEVCLVAMQDPALSRLPERGCPPRAGRFPASQASRRMVATGELARIPRARPSRHRTCETVSRVAVWERRAGGRNVTFPAWQSSVNGQRRSFALLRPANGDATTQEAIRDAILDAYSRLEAAPSGVHGGEPPTPTRPGWAVSFRFAEELERHLVSPFVQHLALSGRRSRSLGVIRALEFVIARGILEQFVDGWRVVVDRRDLDLDDALIHVRLELGAQLQPRDAIVVNVHEVKPRQRETTLNPRTRRLLHVEVSDQIVTDRVINELMGKDASARFRFIMDRAEEAEELDV